MKAELNFEDLKALQKNLNKALGRFESGEVYKEALKEVGRKHLARVVQNTPFGVYPRQVSFIAYKGTPQQKLVSFTVTPKMGGTLKKGWVVDTHSVAEATKGVPSSGEITARVNATPVKVKDNTYSMTFYNHVKYAKWVDQGHRVCRPKGVEIGWCPPQNFIRNSENATASEMHKTVQKHIDKALNL